MEEAPVGGQNKNLQDKQAHSPDRVPLGAGAGYEAQAIASDYSYSTSTLRQTLGTLKGENKR